MSTPAGIVAFGAYVPRLRLQRSSIGAAHAWYAPGLKGLAKGERSMAGWDEDVVTMAVEAARDCLGQTDRNEVSGIILASTTAPFADRQNAVIVKEALNLDDAVATLDVAGSQRAGVSALIQALRTASDAPLLCIASEHRRAAPASEAELTNGDAAAALLVGTTDPIAHLVGWHSLSADFVDHFRAADRTFDYGWESRWIRDEGYAILAPAAIKAALAKANLTGAAIDHFIFPAVMKGVGGLVAKTSGIRAEAVRDTLAATLGEAGAAHPLVMLVNALETARPGERLLVASFGSGCDVVILQATEAIVRRRGPGALTSWLGRRKAEPNYMKYLSFTGGIALERGMRAELDEKQPLTALWRSRKAVMGLVGGRCTESGAVQFPRSEISVHQNHPAIGTQEDYPLAERTARVLTFTSDYLTFSLDPPGRYGMVEFDGGGRIITEFCDCETEDIEVGRPMRMMFRIKAIDERRGFTKYFWKAAPAP